MQKKTSAKIFLVITLLFLTSNLEASWLLKRVRHQDQITELGLVQIAPSSKIAPQVFKSIPEFLVENAASSASIYEEILWPSNEIPVSYYRFTQSRFFSKQISSELRTIVEQGPSSNRICLTFLGDGYKASEKERFFSDVKALVDDLFTGQTFQSYKSLFNVYAVFVPSNESGISDVQQKDTAFGLYRSPAGSKRAIMPGDTLAIEQALAASPKTDYPIVIANDDFYGGLGGRYAITTRSRESGKIVLRHELGHNFGGVGEEYDGGSVYTGANNSATTSISWKQWLKDNQSKIVNDMRFLGGAYVWKNLASGSVVQKFKFPAPNNKGGFWFEVQLSSVGWQSLDDVEILLDGEKLHIEGRGTFDRSFFNTTKVQNLNPGDHNLEIRELKHDGDNILAFANLYAYEADYDFSGGIGAFKTYDDNQSLSYRPTHANCLMRDMLYNYFCAVDQENMWLHFLSQTRLIDEVKISNNSVEVLTPHLDGLSTRWFRIDGTNRTELTEFKNKFAIDRNLLKSGKYQIYVQFLNPEIRIKSDRLLDQKIFEIN